MESGFSGVPLSSSSEMVQEVPLRAAAFGIRAPVTVDLSDVDSSTSSRSPRNGNSEYSNSGSDMESDGSVSGDADSGTTSDSESGPVNDADEESIEETHFLEAYALSKPSNAVVQEENAAEERNDETFAQGSNDVRANEFVRIRVRRLEEISDGDESDDPRPVLSETRDDEPVEDEDKPLAPLASENLPCNQQISGGVGRIWSFKELQVPIARISCDSDEDSLVNERVEDEGVSVSPILRVPSSDYTQSLIGAPKVRTWDADVDSDESETERMKFDGHIVTSYVSLGAENIRDKNLGSIDMHEEVTESEKSKAFGEYEDLDKHAESTDHCPDTKYTGSISCADSADEIGCLDQESRKEAENSGQLPNSEQTSTVSSGDLDAVSEDERKHTSPNDGDIIGETRDIGDQFVRASGAGVDPPAEAIDVIIEPDSPTSVFEAIGESLLIHEAEDFLPLTEDPFVDAGSMILSTRIIAEAMNPGKLVPPLNEDGSTASGEGKDKTMDKLHRIYLNYLHLLSGLHFSPKEDMPSEALQWLKITDARSAFEASHFGFSNGSFLEPELRGKHEMELSLSILVIGKTGVGKSATINSIFGESKTASDAFEPATYHVRELTGMICGVKLSIFDTPGFRNSQFDRPFNQKNLKSIRKATRKFKPDVVLYVDRLNMPTDYLDDLILMRSITSYLGPEIWQRTVVALTHASSELPEGPDGIPLSHEAFVAQRSHVIQQLIIHSSEQLEVLSTVPVCLVENHFPEQQNGRSWKSELLLFCYITKALSEVQAGIDSSMDRKLRNLLTHSPFLSHLWQNRVWSEPSDDYKNKLFDSDIQMNSSASSFQGEDSKLDDLHELESLVKLGIGRDYPDGRLKLQRQLHRDEIGWIRIPRLKGDLFQYRFSVGKMLAVSIYVALNDKLRGHFLLKASCSDSNQLQLAAMVMVSIAEITLNKILSRPKKM